MATDFDFIPYTRTPILDVPAAVALGHALLAAAPAAAPVPVQAAAQKMRQAIGELQKAWATALPPKAEDPRPLDTRYDAAWSALRDRVSAAASLGESDPKLAADAERILRMLFPSGADFLKLLYAKVPGPLPSTLQRGAGRGGTHADRLQRASGHL